MAPEEITSIVALPFMFILFESAVTIISSNAISIPGGRGDEIEVAPGGALMTGLFTGIVPEGYVGVFEKHPPVKMDAVSKISNNARRKKYNRGSSQVSNHTFPICLIKWSLLKHYSWFSTEQTISQ